MLQAVTRHRVGDAVAVRIDRGGKMIDTTVRVPPMSRQPTALSSWAFALIISVLTPWVCILMGFLVVFLRPRDLLAWLLLGLLISFSQLLGTDAARRAGVFPALTRDALIFFNQAASGLWPMFMALFGIYFPDRTPGRIWTKPIRWILCSPIFVIAIANGIGSVVEASDMGAVPWLLGPLVSIDPISGF